LATWRHCRSYFGGEGRDEHEGVLEVVGRLLTVRFDAADAVFRRSMLQASARVRREWKIVKMMTGLKTLSSKLPCEPAKQWRRHMP